MTGSRLLLLAALLQLLSGCKKTRPPTEQDPAAKLVAESNMLCSRAVVDLTDHYNKPLRIVARVKPDSYYNYKFSDAHESHYSLRVECGTTPLGLYGYIPKGIGKELIDHGLAPGTAKEPVTLFLVTDKSHEDSTVWTILDWSKHLETPGAVSYDDIPRVKAANAKSTPFTACADALEKQHRATQAAEYFLAQAQAVSAAIAVGEAELSGEDTTSIVAKARAGITSALAEKSLAAPPECEAITR